MIAPNYLPLPIRDGVAPSYVWIPAGNWRNIFHFLQERFSDVTAETWLDRIARAEVVDQHGTALRADSPAIAGQRIFYYRELEHETPIPFEAHILHRDEHILVVDKPHFLPVIPSGRFLHETLLVRLKKQLNLPHLTPIHRIDRETAGVIIFSHNLASRGTYQSLFNKREINKTYEALAAPMQAAQFPFNHRSRMVDGTPFFRMQEVPGEPNSETRIDHIETRGALSLYRLHPITGKRHQLRVHLASLGSPIVNDTFYPQVQACKGDDYSSPLQLLARAISFNDPLSGEPRYFESERRLENHQYQGG